jgi:hypothetical protein
VSPPAYFYRLTSGSSTLSLKVVQGTLAVVTLVKTEVDVVSMVVALVKRVVEIARTFLF